MSPRNGAFSLIEVVVVIAIIAAVSLIAFPKMTRWSQAQAVKTSIRRVEAAFSLARSEAIRTGNHHIVFIQSDALGNPLLNGSGETVPILVLDDGAPGDPSQNCRIDPGEPIRTLRLDPDVGWGLTNAPGPVASDVGGDPIGGDGSTFTTPGGGAATWVLFHPEGPPLAMNAGCALGPIGSGGGGIYLSNGARDAAVVVTALGAVRVHAWDVVGNRWTN